ncbi:protein phosphatase 1 regulatory subunit 37 isoform X1 [Tribolium castaneum]|uniref:protein phosphatase 1 regulatory subunit 37 isoform X1 n=1 Tax=Tribolium castaneum TaxID=7070 RepID=UPI0030FEB0B8
MMNVMDLSPIINEFDTPFLVDSGTESFTESPVAEEESEHSEDSTVCDIDSSCIQKCHILDKEVSVDEDILAVPLEPIRTQTEPSIVEPNEQDETALPSILRRESSTSSTVRKVSFPKEETELATYREPENDCPWTINTYLPPEKILQIYQASCKQHQTIELDIIKNLIMEIKNNTNHSAVLNLSMINITNEVNETLEDLLKVSNFRTLVLYECKFTSETISEFFNMLEYYGSVCDIEVAMNFDETAWKCFCNACTNLTVLEAISFKGMVINENYMRMLLNAVKSNTRITTLKFDACMLIKLPSFYLVESLMTNTTLCELYLPSTGLYTKEADCLGRFLQKNFTLKVLDISNNFIGDRGLEVLAKGLTKQTTAGCGLSVLVVFNNQVTEKSGPVICSIISECKNLHTLNIGYNHLTDAVISDIAPSLEVTTSLEGLGLQCTLLTCKGIDYLANAIENNNSLQKINLKGNKAIQVPGLERLCQALTSSKISKIEIDETNRSSHDPQAYVQLVKKMNAICTVNKNFKESSCDEIATISQLVSRKVSLSCEPRYVVPEPAPGATPLSVDSPPILSPVPAARPPKNRFQITKVQDPNTRPISRFKVTRVIPSPDEDLAIGKFANVRSSVSSNDSVDSLQLDVDSDRD